MSVITVIFLSSGIIALVAMLSMYGWLGWKLFPSFGYVKKELHGFLGYQLTIAPGISVAEISRFPKDRKIIILSSFLYDVIDEELYEAHTGGLNATLLILVASAIVAALAGSIGLLSVQLIDLLAVLVGGSELIAITIVLIKLKFLSSQTRRLIPV